MLSSLRIASINSKNLHCFTTASSSPPAPAPPARLSIFDVAMVNPKTKVKTWPNGSYWEDKHLKALNLQRVFADRDEVIPKASAPSSLVPTPELKALLAWNTETWPRDCALEPLFTELSYLVANKTEFHTAFFTRELLRIIGFGPVRPTTMVDFVFEKSEAPFYQNYIGIGMEYKRKHQLGIDSKMCDITPQVASQLLAMAQYSSSFRILGVAQPTKIIVHIIEIRGQYFSFWKAEFEKDALEAISQGFPPEKPTNLYVHRKTENVVASAGYDFVNPVDRKIIIESVLAHIYASLT